MDVTEKVNLVLRPPTEEVVTQEELLELFKTNSKPKHYIGIEISGFLHLGSLISTSFKINDFVKAGVDCTIFLADWHTLLNEKLGGSFETIRKVSKYYEDAFRLVCPEANVVLGTDLYDSKKGEEKGTIDIGISNAHLYPPIFNNNNQIFFTAFPEGKKSSKSDILHQPVFTRSHSFQQFS